MVKVPIYFDNHATTRPDPRVLQAMLPCFETWYGNAASREHAFGWQAEELVKQGRKRVAELIGGSEEEIIFTSGATESNNLALKGAAQVYAPSGGHVVTVATEHKSVLQVCGELARQGHEVTFLPVDSEGLLEPSQVREAITPKTFLVTVMAANNEIGVLQPIRKIAEICRERDVLFHTDATQAVGKIPFNLREIEADLVSFSGHKIYGPKGVGALFVRRRQPKIRLAPIIHGGGHERGLRSGTLNVPGIVGFGEACRLCQVEMEEEGERLKALRDRLENGLLEALEDPLVNGHRTLRLPHCMNMCFPGVPADSLLTNLTVLAVSSGAACSSAEPEPSHVLRALGRSEELIRSSLRFGLGRFNTDEEVDFALEHLVAAVKQQRARRGAIPAKDNREAQGSHVSVER